MHWYQYTKIQIESELKTNAQTGLEKLTAKKRLLEHGPNLLPEAPRPGWFKIFFQQFQSPLIYILLICAGIVFYLGETVDAIIIFAVLLINAMIGAVQEGRAGNMLASLKKLSSAEAAVLRGGEEIIVTEAEIVPGDILVLKEGQKVVADARIIVAHNLSVDESMLTGESAAVRKKEGALEEDGLSASGQHNMVFKGTAVLSGDGQAVVVATGVNTEMGKISRSLLLPEAEMPLQKNIKKLWDSDIKIAKFSAN